MKEYFNWCVNALMGGNPVATDNYLKDNLGEIKEAARKLLVMIGYKPLSIYRGIIVKEKLVDNILKPHPNFTYLSFSEDKKLAESFADNGPNGFGSVYFLGNHGYVITHEPKMDEIIFHYKFLAILPVVDAMKEVGIDGSTIHLQKEVTILQPEEPFKVNYYE